jgi:hypothetical protein
MSLLPESPDNNSQIGVPGVPWGPAERARWAAQRLIKRRYAHDVLQRIDDLRGTWDVIEYGSLDPAIGGYPLFALRSRHWSSDRPIALITGGVHGYETSGVLGALSFAEDHASRYVNDVDVLIAPCVSPWAYERIQRWNADAIDPNRSFRNDTTVVEAAALMRLVEPFRNRVLVHLDLHETTDSDETEFRPALAARDGIAYEPDEIPDGFYLCGDAKNPQLDFQAAVLRGVAEITHLAPADADNNIIGTHVSAPSVILYPVREYGLCVGMTNATFTTTTEVYPDSPRTSPEECTSAQIAAVCAGIEFAITHVRK